MTITITVPVTGIPAIECHGGATLTPAQATIRYDRRYPPCITMSGPTRHEAADEERWLSFDFSGCTCCTWLADLVEDHRPTGYRRWVHAEWDAWTFVVGRWINTDGAPDPHRALVAALEAALADTGRCAQMRNTLAQALTGATAGS